MVYPLKEYRLFIFGCSRQFAALTLKHDAEKVGVKDARNIAKNFLFGQLYGIKGEENENTSRTI